VCVEEALEGWVGLEGGVDGESSGEAWSCKIRSSISSTSSSMDWIRGAKASVMSSMSAYEIQSAETVM